MDRRIFVIETEYGVTCTFRGQRRLSPDEVARYLFRRVVSWGRSSNVFLRNGSRLYLDVGSHPEYATAAHPHAPSLPQPGTPPGLGDPAAPDTIGGSEGGGEGSGPHPTPEDGEGGGTEGTTTDEG